MTTMRLTDDAIRRALAMGPEVTAPFELADAIRTAIEATPQRRAPHWVRSPRGLLVAQVLVLVLIAIALIGALAIAGAFRRHASPPTSVLSFHGGPARTGIMPGPAPAGSPIPCWPPVGLTGQASTFVEPAVVNGTIYVGDANGTVTAIDEASGAVRWRSTPRVGPIFSSPAISGTLLVIGSDDGHLYAFDRQTGAVRWAYRTGGAVRSPPTIVDNVAYFGSDDGRLYAIGLASVRPRWAPVQTGGPIDRAVAVANGLIFAGSGSSSGGTFNAYDLVNGHSAWSAAQATGPGQLGTPAVADGRVFVAGGLDDDKAPHRVFAFDERTGHPAWPHPFAVASGANVFVAAVSGGVVYVVSYDKQVWALDAATGTPVWPSPFATKGRLGSVGAIVDSTLYVSSDDRTLYAIDASTGAMRWRRMVGGTSAAPVVIDGRVILATSLGQVVCITGTQSSSRAP